jgi:hypothetical protein
MRADEHITYRFSLPTAQFAALAGEAERKGTTPSRVLEAVLRRYLAGFLSTEIHRSLSGSRERGGPG